jgi:hypothetical protein
MRELFRVQPVMGGCVKRDERLPLAGDSALREVGCPSRLVSEHAQTLGRVFCPFRENRRIKRDQNGIHAFVQIERALPLGPLAFVVRPPRCQDMAC